MLSWIHDKYKYSIDQTKQNIKIRNKTKYESDKIQRYQNTITTNYKLEKIQSNKIQMHQNANVTKYKRTQN